jgi:homopolymeric O-antigen transport system ATP-binding protein
MSDTVIKIENLSKRYLVGHEATGRERSATLRDTIVREGRSFARKAIDFFHGRQIVQGNEIEEFWALRSVSFDVQRGEIVGIIGRNGAGKSTLLKILSRITEPTEGRITLHGRVASLLEVGTGFHQELSGRENIFLNGAILGMTQREIRFKFDEIVAFAEVDRFIDTPVKRYSSGMYVRLAFAVAAHLEPEILIIDEVLAVGDAEFQKKCLGKMSEVARGGRTVLFVSHNHAAVRNLCSHALVLRNGLASPKQDVQSALDEYSSEHHGTLALSWRRPAQLEMPPIYFSSIDVHLEGQQPALRLLCSACIKSAPNARPVFIAVDILDSSFASIMQALPKSEPFIGGVHGTSWVDLIIELPPLIPGVYHLDFWIGPHYTQTFDYIKEAIAIEITDSPTAGRNIQHTKNHGFIVPISSARVRTEPFLAGCQDQSNMTPLA